MATKLRFTRHGAKKKPFYWLVAADARAPRDGRYIEKLGTYNPLLPKDNKDRIVFNKERINYWLSNGAQPTEKIEKLFNIEGIEVNFKKKKFRKQYEVKTDRGPKLSKKAIAKAEEEAKNAELAKAEEEAAKLAEANNPAPVTETAAPQEEAQPAPAESPSEEKPAEENGASKES
jgi:small subunit ribosomal protein S16